ncbi:MAG TPA: cell division protein FtsA [Candidatus Cloacimonetes bacterium]|jgi:cell division protein FtsA|nr:cell division protein FtsA [Candidatus Cloacimonadota bacterium]
MKHGIITALDIGSSYVRSIIARLDENREISVLGIGEAPTLGMEQGTVTDIEALSKTIRASLEEAETLAKVSADNIFVNITGTHIKTQLGDGRISISGLSPNEPGEIDTEHVQQVIEDAKNSVKIQKGFEHSRILHAMPQSYVIDGQANIKNPISMNAFHLTAQVYTILAEITPIRNLAKCIELAGYEFDSENIVLNHVALSHSALSRDEKRLGCILIDIGGGTCDIALYNRGSLEKIAVIPMAGHNITEDLAIGLKTTIDSAELLKCNYGLALTDGIDPNLEVEVEGISGRPATKRSQQLISHVVSRRVEEILNLCYNKLVGLYTPELVTAGVVLCGGSSLLKRIDEAALQTFNLHVKLAKPSLEGMSGSVSRLDDPAFCTAVGILHYASSLEREYTSTSLTKKAGAWGNKIKNFIKKIYRDFVPE